MQQQKELERTMPIEIQEKYLPELVHQMRRMRETTDGRELGAAKTHYDYLDGVRTAIRIGWGAKAAAALFRNAKAVIESEYGIPANND